MPPSCCLRGFTVPSFFWGNFGPDGHLRFPFSDTQPSSSISVLLVWKRMPVFWVLQYRETEIGMASPVSAPVSGMQAHTLDSLLEYAQISYRADGPRFLDSCSAQRFAQILSILHLIIQIFIRWHFHPIIWKIIHFYDALTMFFWCRILFSFPLQPSIQQFWRPWLPRCSG